MPKYIELVNWLREQIESENLLPGQKINTEKQLKDMFHMSRQAVRHSLAVLEKEGLVYKVQGSGTYISKHCRERLKMQSKLVWIVIPYNHKYQCQKQLKGIERVLVEQGYTMQIAVTDNQPAKERKVLESILSQGKVAGIIIEPAKTTVPNPNLNFYKKLQKQKISILFLNNYFESLKIPHISMNYYILGKKAAECLIAKKHPDYKQISCKNIGGIFRLDTVQGHQSYSGFLESCMEEGIPINDKHIIWIDEEEEKNLTSRKERIWERLWDCNGVFYSNMVEDAKVEDIFSEENSDSKSITTVSMEDLISTSIVSVMEKLGEKAAENLIKMICENRYDVTYEYIGE